MEPISRQKVLGVGINVAMQWMYECILEWKNDRLASVNLPNLHHWKLISERYLSASPQTQMLMWLKFTEEFGTGRSRVALERIGLNASIIEDLHNQADPEQKAKAQELVITAFKDQQTKLPWFLLGLMTPMFLSEDADVKLRKARQIGFDQQVLQWRLVLQAADVQAEERDRLEALLHTMRKAQQPAVFVQLVRICERLADQAMLLDRRDGDKEIMDSKIQANFYGDVTGTVNLGRLVGNVYSSVTKLAENPAAREVADALSSLTQAIQRDMEMAPSKKTEALETIETLSEQARLSPGERKISSFKAALGYLPTLLSSVVSGTKIWETFGPTIEGYFGN